MAYSEVARACGHDANASLVGIHRADRKEEDIVTEVRPGVFMGAYFDLDASLDHSVYASRA
ncbi:hypothetical protein B0T16DRAFT_450691 [Cercophora newfieldiana]|uniref:Uncharacterized protein n=1 Tax=Cercophora newfieldiana TaxID=92897 RepID=A0AA39YLT7_9PEZI|nr:hypothetical protein B0T16DRAFT_450691 [Cercophora newfieldiana]